MKIINDTVTSEILVTKSRFISTLFNVANEEEVKTYLEQTRKKYFDARHNCYAYILYDPNNQNNIIKKSSDDGEPSGTAGSPILENLVGADLVNVLCVVTRYFGGFLLGTGGLTRAYASACKDCINLAHSKNLIANLYTGYKIVLIINYDIYNKIKKVLETKVYKEIENVFSDKVEMKFLIKVEDLPSFQKEVSNITLGSIDVLPKDNKLFTFSM